MKLLFVEDQPAAGEATTIVLSREYAVDWVKTIKEAETCLAVNQYDGFVLDLALPDGNGKEFCKLIRQKQLNQPILILTSSDDVSDVVTALDGGADDYLTKPYNATVLMAHLRALFRRPQTIRTDVITIGDAVIDLNRRSVTRSDSSILLRRKEYDLLQYLIANHERAVPRHELFEHVWDSESNPLSNTVDVHIKMLRDKLGHSDDNPIIITIPGVGYQLSDIHVSTPADH